MVFEWRVEKRNNRGIENIMQLKTSKANFKSKYEEKEVLFWRTTIYAV